MKKVFFITIAICAFTIVAQAQTTDDKPTKEEKANAKAQQDQQLNDALHQIGLTDDEATQVKNILKDALQKSNQVKKDTTLNDDEKTAKKEAINNEKNDKLKQVMGADRYRQWNAVRKRNKELNMGPLGPD
jgi:hypothetical protein